MISCDENQPPVVDQQYNGDNQMAAELVPSTSQNEMLVPKVETQENENEEKENAFFKNNVLQRAIVPFKIRGRRPSQDFSSSLSAIIEVDDD